MTQPKSALKERGKVPLFLVIFFMSMLAVLSFLGLAPSWVLAVYFAVSLLSFAMYGFDKWMATNQRWRINEATLHLMALAGGWPGAIIAQQLFRHKTSKASFKLVFWISVAVNIGGLFWYLSPPS